MKFETTLNKTILAAVMAKAFMFNTKNIPRIKLSSSPTSIPRSPRPSYKNRRTPAQLHRRSRNHQARLSRRINRGL